MDANCKVLPRVKKSRKRVEEERKVMTSKEKKERRSVFLNAFWNRNKQNKKTHVMADL
jgi:hypothetical protein